jgi:hypothetical protein
MAGVGSRRKGLQPIAKDLYSDGLPIIPRKPEVARPVKCPKFKGSYFFGDSAHLPMNFDHDAFYETVKNRAWTVLGSVEVLTVPGALDVLPLETVKKLKVFKTPSSSFWQSVCGRYTLYPKDEHEFEGFTINGKEKDFKKWLLPSVEWEEFYCVSSVPGVKYNFRNRKYIKFFLLFLIII